MLIYWMGGGHLSLGTEAFVIVMMNIIWAVFVSEFLVELIDYRDEYIFSVSRFKIDIEMRVVLMFTTPTATTLTESQQWLNQQCHNKLAIRISFNLTILPVTNHQFVMWKNPFN